MVSLQTERQIYLFLFRLYFAVDRVSHLCEKENVYKQLNVLETIYYSDLEIVSKFCSNTKPVQEISVYNFGSQKTSTFSEIKEKHKGVNVFFLHRT